jgi:putative FmdB family regulatory protein
MPLYEYECSACGHRFELIQRFSDPPVSACVACGQGPVLKLLSAPAVHFKGTGWYVTDYAKKSGASAVRTDAGPGDTPAPAAASGATTPASSSSPAENKKPASAPESKPAAETK